MSSLASAPTLSRRHAVRLSSAGLAMALAAGGQRSAAAGDQTTLEANKAIVRRVFEAVNANTPDAVYELYAPDFVDRSAFPDQLPGPAGIEKAIADFHTLLPDVHITPEAMIAEGDLVATREEWRGTDPATGQEITGTTLHFWRIAQGKIVEEWSAGWEWLEQIGATQATPAAAT